MFLHSIKGPIANCTFSPSSIVMIDTNRQRNFGQIINRTKNLKRVLLTAFPHETRMYRRRELKEEHFVFSEK